VGQKTENSENHMYVAIDLKSFYASVECNERGLDPLKTNLVVADASRTEKTICLAVSPSLKQYGIPGRARLFEVVQKVREINAIRRKNAPGQKFTGKSCDAEELRLHPEYELDYIAAPPRMRFYIDYSTQIYNIYLKYIAAEDIHVYSIDEVFMDVAPYLRTYGMTAHELTQKMIRDVLDTTHITATAGIAPNMYLCKVAMDIVAKHCAPDEFGVRIAELDELSYRKQLWDHRPLTDFWRVGRGISKKLEQRGIFTMGDVARCAVENEDLLYHLFGVNAELLIDHAFGWEPATIPDIKKYRPKENSISSGQVLQSPYTFEKAAIIVREMTELLTLDLVDKGLVTNQLVLTIGFDVENLKDPGRAEAYHGEVVVDHYGRRIPKHAHGTVNLERKTASTKMITEAVLKLYHEIVDPALLIRRINIAACKVISEKRAEREMQEMSESFEQMDLFTDYEAREREKKKQDEELEREKKAQKAILEIQKKFGKNALLKGTSLEEGATTMQRNGQIGGHKA